MQAPFPLFGALNVPYRIIELLHTNRHRELLRLYCRFDSYRERSILSGNERKIIAVFLFQEEGGCLWQKNSALQITDKVLK